MSSHSIRTIVRSARRRWTFTVASVIGWLAISSATTLFADEGLPVSPPERAEKVRFAEEIQPFLAANCTACHNAKVREGGLMLDSVKAIVAGGSSGPAVIAGKPAESLLFARAAHRQEDFMPPPDNKVGARNLSPTQLGLLERWITEGAVADTAAGKPVAWRTPPAGTGGVVAVAISADGRTTAAARGGTVSLFDTRSGRLLQPLVDQAIATGGAGQSHRDVVSAVAFAPGGDRLATGSFRTVRIWRRLPPAKVAEIADSGGATAVAVAPSRSIAAIGFSDGRLAIVDPGTGRIARTITAHAGAVTGLAFGTDGEVLHSCGRDGLVLTTKVGDGSAVARLARQGEVRALALLSGGTRLATADADNVVRIWTLPLPAPPAEGAAAAATAPLKELSGLAQPTTALVELPTMSGHLLTGSGDGIVRLWNADTAAIVRQFAHEAAIAGIAVSPDGTRLATVGTAPGVKLWETGSGKRLAEAKGDPRIADRLAEFDVTLAVERQDVEFAKAQVAAAEKAVPAAAEESKKAAELVSNAEKKLVEKAAAADAATRARQDADAVAAKATAAVPVATQVHEAATKVSEAATSTVAGAAAAVAAFKAKATDAAEADLLKKLEAAAADATKAKGISEQAVKQAAQQVEQAKVQAAEATKKATETMTSQTAAEEERKKADLSVTTAKRAVEFAAEQEKRAAAELPLRTSELKTAESRLAATEEARKKIEAESAASAKPFVSASFSGDGAWLACLDADGRLIVLGAADGQPRVTCDGPRPAGPGGTAAFVGGTRLLVAGTASAATIWEAVESWTLERTIGGEGTPPATDDDDSGPPVDIVTALAFSRDGVLLASGSGRPSRSGEIKLWKAADGGLVRTIAQPHSDTVMALEFSRRGDLLASGGADRFLKVHAVADGKPVRSFEGHTGHVLGVAWQANGRRLASAGADGAIKVWEFASGVQQRTIAVGKKEVTAARFVAAGEELLAASGDPALRLYNAASGAVARDFGGPGAYLQSAAAAGGFAVAGAQDGRLRIWDLAAGTPLHTLEPSPRR